jgi:hypothetical protein
VRRRRAELTCVYGWDDVVAAVAGIRAVRAEAGDPRLSVWWPAHVVDGDDVDAVLSYVADPAVSVEPAVRQAELPHVAVLVEWARQQAQARYEARSLWVLDMGVAAGARPASYGGPLGFPTSQAIHNRRVVLRERGRPVPAPAAGAVGQWLVARRTELLVVADMLVDHRDQLVGLVAPSRQAGLVEAIDAVGEGMGAVPTRGFAAAIGYAVFLLGATASPDPVVRDGCTLGERLRREYDQLDTQAG